MCTASPPPVPEPSAEWFDWRSKLASPPPSLSSSSTTPLPYPSPSSFPAASLASRLPPAALAVLDDAMPDAESPAADPSLPDSSHPPLHAATTAAERRDMRRILINLDHAWYDRARHAARQARTHAPAALVDSPELTDRLSHRNLFCPDHVACGLDLRPAGLQFGTTDVEVRFPTLHFQHGMDLGRDRAFAAHLNSLSPEQRALLNVVAIDPGTDVMVSFTHLASGAQVCIGANSSFLLDTTTAARTRRLAAAYQRHQQHCVAAMAPAPGSSVSRPLSAADAALLRALPEQRQLVTRQ